MIILFLLHRYKNTNTNFIIKRQHGKWIVTYMIFFYFRIPNGKKLENTNNKDFKIIVGLNLE